MRLQDKMEHILQSIGISDDALKIIDNQQEVVTGIVESPVIPQSLLKVKFNDTSYSNNVNHDMSNNTRTVLTFKHTHIRDTECNVVVTVETQSDRMEISARIITYVQYDKFGNYMYV